MRQTTIVVIDDHPLFRQGVVDILSAEKDLKVVGQASNGEDGLRMVRERKPDVALIDVNLPGMNGLQVTRQISLLGISQQTIKNHVTAILRKLGVADRTQAAIFALRHGWVRMDEHHPSSEE